MSFPTSEFLQSEMLFYRLLGLAKQITTRLSDCGAEAEVGHTPASLRQCVKVPVDGGGAVLLFAEFRLPGAWRVSWPDGFRLEHTAWPLETPEDVLVEIVELAFRHGVSGQGLPSPFSWGHTEANRIIELADHLVRQGVDRHSIGLTPLRPLSDDLKLLARGHASRLELTDREESNRSLVVRSHGDHGWTVDQVMDGVGASGRLNLPDALQVNSEFGITADADVVLENLAEVLVEDTGWFAMGEGAQLFRFAETPKLQDVFDADDARVAARRWLTWAGVLTPEGKANHQAADIELLIDWRERPVDPARVQRYMGIAAAKRRTAIVVARDGFSRRTSEWGDEAGMILFSITSDGALRPANAAAELYTPVAIGDRPWDCDDPTCRTIGCVLDSGFCPNDRGRASDPDCLRWRL